MLTTIRNKATSLISYVLIAAICLSFALWGINSYFEGATQVDVASVNGDDVSYDYYQNQMRQRQQQMREMFQNNLPEDYFENDIFKRQTLESIVDEVLLNQVIRERRYTLDDEELAKSIRDNQAFYTDGKFDEDRYRRLLVSNNWTVQSFEDSQRRQGAYDQVRQAVSESVLVDDEELNDILKLRQQKRIAEYVVIESSGFEPEVSDAEIQQQYDEFIDLYKTPEQVKVDYVELSTEALAGFEQVSDEDIDAYYQENKAGFSKPEARIASHILITPENDSEEADQQALAQSLEVLEKIRAGEDFAELAKEYSQDKGSANNGGDLGVVGRGVMVPPFEDAVFSMSEGEVSEPVKTDFGYHIIKLTELSEEQTRPLDEVRDDIVKTIQNNRALEQFLELSEQFRNLAFENPESLQPIADELGLEIKQSDWFTRSGGPGIGSENQVRDVAFSGVVLDDGLNGDVIEIGDDRLIALRRNDYQSSQPRPLDEVKEQITSLLMGRKSQEMAEARGEQLLKALLQDPLGWQALIESEGLSPVELPQTRDGVQGGVDKAISTQVFEQPRPQAGQPVYGGTEVGGGYAVYRLSRVEDADDAALAAITDEQRDALRALMEQRFGRENVASLFASLKEKADIRIFEENL